MCINKTFLTSLGKLFIYLSFSFFISWVFSCSLLFLSWFYIIQMEQILIFRQLFNLFYLLIPVCTQKNSVPFLTISTAQQVPKGTDFFPARYRKNSEWIKSNSLFIYFCYDIAEYQIKIKLDLFLRTQMHKELAVMACFSIFFAYTTANESLKSIDSLVFPSGSNWRVTSIKTTTLNI